MGYDYAYEFIGTRKAADRLLRSLSVRLNPSCAIRTSDTLDHSVEKMVEHAEAQNEPDRRIPLDAHPACLTFLFPEDDAISEYVTRRPEEYRPAPDSRGRVSIACVWTTLYYGDEFVRIRAEAAGSKMSILFQDSPSVRDTFVSAGEEGGAVLVAFDNEAPSDLLCVWPHMGRIAPEDFEWRDLKDTDVYCADLIRAMQDASGDSSQRR